MTTLQERIDAIVEQIKQETDNDTLFIQIPKPHNKRMLSYASMIHDLNLCTNAMIQLQKMEKDDVIISPCLFFTFIILYGKCFAKSSSSKLEEDVFKSNPNLLKLHRSLMNMRHQYVAHRGASIEEVGVPVMKIKMNYAINPKVKTLSRITPDKDQYDSYLGIIDFVRNVAVDKFSEVAMIAWNKLIKENSAEQLSGLIIAGHFDNVIEFLKKVGPVRKATPHEMLSHLK